MSSQPKNSRDKRRAARKKQARNNNLIVGLLIGAALLLVAFLVYKAVGRPPLGELQTISGEGQHVPDGNPLPVYDSDPPTSGPHYVTPLPEGFYDTDSVEATSLPNAQGFIVHSMEHGYVIFWYNCAVAPGGDCETLKDEVRTVMAGYDDFKIIAFPWATTDVPVVMTSWGRMLEMPTWDEGLAKDFIERNRNQAPEPNAR